MGCLVSIIVGAVVGWIASMLMHTNAQMGWLYNILVGMVGSALGHFVARLLGVTSTSRLGRFVVALAGAALLIAILRWLGFLGAA